MYIESYKQLIVWQKSIQLVRFVYELTEKFPKNETYGLISQMRRAAVSIPSNIAEGYKRKGLGEYLNFLSIADASAAELETQFIIAEDLYKKIDFTKAVLLLEEVQKMLVVIIKKLIANRYTLNANNSGFTLVEMMVAFLIFSIILTIFSSVFLSSSQLQKRAFNIQQAEENANYVLESMAKEIRVSKISGPDSNCPSSPASTLSITHPVNGNIVYSLNGTSVQRTVGGTVTTISSNTVDFTRLQFCISGTPTEDKKQPRVTILASIRSKKTQQQASVDIQTTVSQRFLSDQ